MPLLPHIWKATTVAEELSHSSESYTEYTLFIINRLLRANRCISLTHRSNSTRHSCYSCLGQNSLDSSRLFKSVSLKSTVLQNFQRFTPAKGVKSRIPLSVPWPSFGSVLYCQCGRSDQEDSLGCSYGHCSGIKNKFAVMFMYLATRILWSPGSSTLSYRGLMRTWITQIYVEQIFSQSTGISACI
jgi:hypothetical protein